VVRLRRQEISIEDIAQAAGVSHSTVSRALHDSSLISVDVRERIQQLARQMGYTPNAIARSLQTQRTNTIGLVVTSIDDPFFGDIVKGVEEVTQDAKLSVVLSTSHNDPEREMSIIETLHQRRVDGILVAASRISRVHKDRLDRIQVPTVLINNRVESHHKLLHWVTVDDRKGAKLAVEHLLQLGHRSIGYLGVESRPRSNQQRLEGYQKALAAAGISRQDAWVAIASGSEASLEEDVAVGQSLLPRLLETGITAVFCYNDMVAIGVLCACREQGIRVPEELSVIGFDDIKMADYVTPALTTIHQAKASLGRLATEMLLDLLNARPVRNRILAPTLKLRASTTQLIRV
jgi:LacI family transcriptional regulator/LacI family repressor for deo operon, udp, cdd, tsx, nupC, and nupG